MPTHSYTRLWVHLIWGTFERGAVLSSKAAIALSSFLEKYAASKNIFSKINYVNSDHVHILIDLPSSMAIDDVVQLLKGASSHWLNQNDLVQGRFSWGRGYGAFSVSESALPSVCRYIEGQKEHHRIKSFTEEVAAFSKKYGLEWKREE